MVNFNFNELVYLMRSDHKEIISATNNFSDENLITKGPLGNVYKGQLLDKGRLLNVAIRRLDYTYAQGNELETEISTLMSLRHNNIASNVSYFDEYDEKIIVYEEGFHGTLDQHLSDPNLTWSQRLIICLGVARALNYIHYDVIHCDISSSKVFLDKDWEPKIYGFELSTEYPESRRHPLLFSNHFDTNNLTPKYDVYLFGVLLLEVLYGRKSKITNDGVEIKVVDEIIDPNIRDTKSLTQFKNLAYKCLNPQLAQRPTMDQIVKELEDVCECHLNPEHTKAVDEYEGTSSSTMLKINFLKIPLSKINEATNNFDEKYLIGSGGYANVYKAKLDVLNVQSLSSLEGKREDELPMINKVVSIKRLFHEGDREMVQQNFLAELNVLATCNHPNIATFVGFSRENDELILVYEYLKGCLGDYLEGNDKTLNLSWAQRLKVSLDIANGIQYLHTNMEGKPTILHRDIKSHNILLDENLNAKVTDFGLSRLCPVNLQASSILSMHIVGTEPYLDPKYLTTYAYRKESDIYSFGVVLFELLCGRLAYDSTYIGENHKGLANVARRHFNEGTLKGLIDPKLTEEDHDTVNRRLNLDSFNTFSEIAHRCLAEIHVRRPTMEVVIKELQNALNQQVNQ